MALPVGATAPDFTLKAVDHGEIADINLGEQLRNSNVMLLFFPGAFTSVCESELCDVSAGMQAYEGLNAAVFGISNDSPFALKAWAERAPITVPLLSDFQKEVSRAYDVVWPDFAGLGPGTARAAFVIDRKGVVRYSEQTPTLRDLPDFDAIRRTLEALG